MANRNKKNSQNKNQGRRGKGGRNYDTIKQPFNFQDNAEVKEYNKGERAGAAAIVSGKHDNDPAWYTPSNTLLSNVASFPTDLRVGLPIEMTFQNDGKIFTSRQHIDQPTPGILAYEVIPYAYAEGKATDPINLCGSALYTAMQVNSSRNPTYQANDLVLYLMAVTSAYSCLAWAERAYGTSDDFNIMNGYLPGPMVHAQGFNYPNVKKNRANFRTAINTYAYELGSFYLPTDIDYVARQVFLYQTVYRDSNTAKSQFYLYKPATFLRWVEGKTSSAGVAVPTFLESVGEELEDVTVDQWIEIMESLLNPLRQSDDIRLMASDLLKAFGIGASYQLSAIADTFHVTPEYNEEVLMQFENAYIMPPLCHGDNFSIGLTYTQNTALNSDAIYSNLIYNTPTTTARGGTWIPGTMTEAEFFAAAQYCTPNEILMNFHVDNPSPEQVMVAARLSGIPWNGVTGSINTENKFAAIGGFARGGTEVIAGARMYYSSEEQFGEGTVGYHFFNISTSMFRQAAQTEMGALFNFFGNLMGLLDTWDWHPKVNFGLVEKINTPTGGSTTSIRRTEFFYDLETWLKISLDEWDSMNKIAMFGLFECTLGSVPRIR